MMNRVILSCLIILLVLPIVSQGRTARVLLLTPEDNSKYLVSDMMLKIEAGAMINILEEAGYEVDVATGSGKTIVSGLSTFTPDHNFAEIDVNDYDGLILPSVKTPRSKKISEQAAKIINQFNDEGKPIAAQANGIAWLGEVGILSGKKFSFVSASVNNIRLRNQLKDGILINNRPIVKDGNIITSGVGPDISQKFNLHDGTSWLTKAFIEEITDRQ